LHYFKQSWRHEGFSKGVTQWLDRHNRYSSEEAELLLRLRREPIQWSALWGGNPMQRRGTLKRIASRLPCRPLIWFLYLYIGKGGFLDGYPGLLYCALILANQTYTQAKIAEIQIGRSLPGPPTRL
jgi:hypothetical protein